jgi:hypothetical protein
MCGHRRILLTATALFPLLFHQAYANDFSSGLIGGVIGGMLGGMQQQQQQRAQQQQQQLQQQQLQQQQILLQQQQGQLDAERQKAAEARQRTDATRRQAAAAKIAADKAAADRAKVPSDAAVVPTAAPATGPAVTVPATPTQANAAAPVAAPTSVPAIAASSVPPQVTQTVVAPPLQVPLPVAAQTVISATVIATLTNEAAEDGGLIVMFNAIIDEQQKMAADDASLSDVAGQAIEVLQTRVKEIQARFFDKTTELSRYRTSIKPNDPDLQITARKASEIYPKVPYYIPGTPETGEFWMEPVVTDVGDLTFNLRFIDPKAENDKTRGLIPLTTTEVEVTQRALVQIVKWAKVAHEKHIRRSYTQRAACFPDDRCPAENGPKREGVASTEVSFKVYEDGSTAGRIQRNKGRFEDGYNISIDSASMLQAYFHHVLTEGKTDFEAGSRTNEQMKELFKPGT